MSEVNTVQAVVDEADPLAKPSGEVAPNARKEDDLDTLLNDPVFNNSKSDPNPKPEPSGTTPDTKPPVASNDGAISEVLQRFHRIDMNETIKKVRGELDSTLFDDTLVEAWLDAQARADSRLSNAWVNRHANPKAFEKVVEGLGRTFVKKYGNLPDKAATEDRAVVTAAVRGASTKAPEGAAPDFSKMSDAEFQKAKDAAFKD